jgi:flagellar motor switch protein FliN
MNQMTPGKLAPREARAKGGARKPDLEIAFEPDFDPLADLPSLEAVGAGDGPAASLPPEAFRDEVDAGAAGPLSPGETRGDGADCAEGEATASGINASGTNASGIDASGVDASGTNASGIDASGVDASGINAGGRAGQERADQPRANRPRPSPPADPVAAARLLGIPTSLARIEVTVTVEVGRTRMPIAELVSVEPGALVALDRMADSPVDILVNGKLFAHGEIVAIGDRFGVRISDLCDPGDDA